MIFSAIPALSFLAGEAFAGVSALIPLCPPDPVLRFAALLRHCHPKGDGEGCAHAAREILQGLKMPVKMMDAVQQLVLHQHLPVDEENLQELLWRLGEEGLARLLAFRGAMAALQQEQTEKWALLTEKMAGLLASGCCHQLSHLAVKGSDLSALGLRGPAIGRMLEMLMMQVVHGKIPNIKESLLNFVRSNTEHLA